MVASIDTRLCDPLPFWRSTRQSWPQLPLSTPPPARSLGWTVHLLMVVLIRWTSPSLRSRKRKFQRSPFCLLAPGFFERLNAATMSYSTMMLSIVVCGRGCAHGLVRRGPLVSSRLLLLRRWQASWRGERGHLARWARESSAPQRPPRCLSCVRRFRPGLPPARRRALTLRRQGALLSTTGTVPLLDNSGA